MSTAPAGVNGTTMRSAFEGKVCADAGTAMSRATARANRRDTDLAFKGRVRRNYAASSAPLRRPRPLRRPFGSRRRGGGDGQRAARLVARPALPARTGAAAGAAADLDPP